MTDKETITLIITVVSALGAASMGVYKWLKMKVLNENQLVEQTKFNTEFKNQLRENSDINSEVLTQLRVMRNDVDAHEKQLEKHEERQEEAFKDIAFLKGKVKGIK